MDPRRRSRIDRKIQPEMQHPSKLDVECEGRAKRVFGGDGRGPLRRFSRRVQKRRGLRLSSKVELEVDRRRRSKVDSKARLEDAAAGASRRSSSKARLED